MLESIVTPVADKRSVQCKVVEARQEREFPTRHLILRKSMGAGCVWLFRRQARMETGAFFAHPDCQSISTFDKKTGFILVMGLV
jgi:hypothetical protein